MTDDEIIDKMARAMCHEYADGSICDNAPCFHCKKESHAALAVAKPLIRAQALDEAETKLREISNAMFEKAESIRSGKTPFALATVEEKDAAVMAGDFEKAAEAIRALKDKIND